LAIVGNRWRSLHELQESLIDRWESSPENWLQIRRQRPGDWLQIRRQRPGDWLQISRTLCSQPARPV
jgi:hypothetical protein